MGRGRLGGAESVDPSVVRMGRVTSDCRLVDWNMLLVLKAGDSPKAGNCFDSAAPSFERADRLASGPVLFADKGPEKNDWREIDGMEGMEGMDGIEGIEGKASRILFIASAPPDEERRCLFWPNTPDSAGFEVDSPACTTICFGPDCHGDGNLCVGV